MAHTYRILQSHSIHSSGTPVVAECRDRDSARDWIAKNGTVGWYYEIAPYVSVDGDGVYQRSQSEIGIGYTVAPGGRLLSGWARGHAEH